MRNVSTFGAFTTARLGIFAAQKGLEVTGNNMTNINTTGYTRQRLDQVSFVSGGTSYYATPMGTKVGNGVITTGVSQLRDPFLDIAYRNAQSNVGQEDTTLAWLDEVAAVLDEVGDGDDDNGVIYNQIQTVIDQLSQMITEGAGHDEYDTLVRTAAQGLTNLFNTYANDLEKVKERLEGSLDQDVKTVNELLKNIQEYNEQIRKADIRGDSALELRDQRNLALDQLSYYMKINVKYEMVDVGSGTMVENLVVTLDNDGGPDHEHQLINGIYVTQLSVGDEADGYDVSLSVLEDRNGTDLANSTSVDPLTEGDLIGALQGSRDMLNGAGEFADDTIGQTSERGIPYYQKSLDLLANEFARVMNEANIVRDNTGNIEKGGILFDAGHGSNPTTGEILDEDGNPIAITAANISISNAWSTGETKLLCSREDNPAGGATDNLTHILAELTSKDHKFYTEALENPAFDPEKPGTATAIFTGSLQDMFLNIESVLGNDISSTTVVLTSYATTADGLYMDRDAVSGVDLNEEAANMMQYQKAYSAACRLMTALDQALDKLINGTGVVGL